MKKGLFVLPGVLLLAGLLFTGCPQEADSTPTPTPTPAPAPTPTTGTLVVYNEATSTNWSLTKVEIFKGTSASGTAETIYTTPIRVRESKEWQLSPGAYYVRVTENTSYTGGKIVSVELNGTATATWNGTYLQ
jgi:archaellum component FlaG (FlaF/FlaG flagellin family)